MGIAFAASIGGLGTLVGSPTNAIAVGLLDKMIGMEITFFEWSLYGIPIVLIGVPLAAYIIAKVQKVAEHPFDVTAARAAIATGNQWTTPEKRLVPIVFLTLPCSSCPMVRAGPCLSGKRRTARHGAS